MEDFDKIKTNIKGYIRRNLKMEPDSPQNSIEMNLKKLDGLSNYNYHVTISNKTTNEILNQVVYRKFGEISELVDRDLETMIINSLSDQEIGPKIFEKDPKNTYRIDEFLVDTLPIPNDSKFEPSILEQISRILVSYSAISYVYEYKTHYDSLTGKYSIFFNPMKTFKREGIEYPIVKQNIFDMCMKDMYFKALKEWERFAEQFKANITLKSNKIEYKKYEKFDYYMKNYQSIFIKTFPTNGVLTLNHNDVHRLNIIVSQQTDKLYILDHEYSALNQIGNDIANYNNESAFNYSPEYYFKPENVDYDFFFKTYQGYLDLFQKEYKALFDTQQGKSLFNKIRTKEYYINLHSCINLFWLLYCGIYLNWNEYIEGNGFSYFQHGIDRLEYFEKGENEKKKN